MDKKALCIGLIIIILLLMSGSLEGFNNSKRMCNNLDGRCHRVHGTSYQKARESSLMMAKINLFCINFLRRLREKYLFNSRGTAIQQSAVHFLISNYDPDTFIEHAPVGPENNSYVKNKGDEFGLCLREKQSGKNKLHNFSTLQFVVLHELSHLASRSIGHNEEFYKNFKMLLKDAKEFGLYQPINYRENPVPYCNIMIEDNPYFS